MASSSSEGVTPPALSMLERLDMEKNEAEPKRSSTSSSAESTSTDNPLLKVCATNYIIMMILSFSIVFY